MDESLIGKCIRLSDGVTPSINIDVTICSDVLEIVVGHDIKPIFFWLDRTAALHMKEFIEEFLGDA